MNRCLVTALALAIIAPTLAAQPNESHLERARRILRSTPLIDGHNDLPWEIRRAASPFDVDAYDLRKTTPGHTDLERLRKGMLGAQFWSVYIPGDISDSGFARVQLEQIDIGRRVIEKYPELEWTLTAPSIRAAFREGKIGSLLGVEGGHAIENSLGALRTYYDLGVRYMTLTHNVTLDWADAAMDEPRHGGLTAFGEEVVREMNRTGLIVDLSHVSPGTMSDALNVTEAPVMFSHSSARAIADVPRNVPDSILRRLKTNGGVVMVTFVPGFISPEVVAHAARRQTIGAEIRTRFPNDTIGSNRELAAWDAAHPTPRATLSQVADHIDHIKRVAGPDHVGIGGDFDGIDEVIVGLEDVSTYPALFAELSRRGWTEADLRKLAGENILRVLEQVDAVAKRLRTERTPSTKTIQQLDGKKM
jgi:membrane dipeptidase